MSRGTEQTEASEHLLEALQALQRARLAVDELWTTFRPIVPSSHRCDDFVHVVVLETVTAHNALETALECSLREVVEACDDDPQSMDVSDWPSDGSDRANMDEPD